VNYQLPDEIETYTHRSGRTGRAGKLGTSIVIVTKANCVRFLLLKESSSKIRRKTVPSGIEICETQLLHLANKIKEEVDHEIDNYLPAINNVLKTYRRRVNQENGFG
jgi:ATP-dependent RNA helicase DeaD